MRVTLAYVMALCALPLIAVGFVGGFIVMCIMAGVQFAVEFMEYIRAGVNVKS